MTTKKIQGTTYGFVQVPEDAKCRLAGRRIIVQKRFPGMFGLKHYFEDASSIYLPKDGNWLLLGKADELNEEQAAGIVEGGPKFYQDYQTILLLLSMTATESLQSLIQSLGMEFKLTVVLKLNDKG